MIYLDHAATTPLDERLLPILQEELRRPSNPASIHAAGQSARRRLESARARLAALLGLDDPSLVVFTSGATEAANLVLRSLAAAPRERPLRVATSDLEHSCVRDTAEALAAAGRIATASMTVSPAGRAAVPDEPADLLCLMHANNETGVLQNTAAAAAWRAKHGGLWLCDISQTAGKVSADAIPPADFLILSGHKFHAPPGIGAIAGPGVAALAPQITGGPHENEHRAGTPAVALAVAMVRALELAAEEHDARVAHLLLLEETFLSALAARVPDARLNGEGPRVPGLLNVGLPGVEAADAVIALDRMGYCVSAGAACATGVVSTSPVLAIMYPDDAERAAGGIRISFGPSTQAVDVPGLVAALSALRT